MTSIVLADDHQVVRQALRLLLAAEPDLQVVGEAGDGLGVACLVERLRPDVLVVDLMMPGLNGLEVTRQVRERCPATRVVILSMHDNEAYVLEALRNGAAGFILKDASAIEFLAGVRAVASGRRYLSPPLSDRALEAYAQMAASSVQDPYELLTPRARGAAPGRRRPGRQRDRRPPHHQPPHRRDPSRELHAQARSAQSRRSDSLRHEARPRGIADGWAIRADEDIGDPGRPLRLAPSGT
jgi:DNA-binding NarL/FixJ family response regulator